MIFRLMAKHVARSIGCVASFMPKPWSNAFGSGAHFNISLADRKSGRNMFEAAKGAKSREGKGYAELAYHFTAGVLHHADAITAVVCPTINSYKRLNPRGFMNEMSWAPVYRAHGSNNRTLMCRLPMNRRCLELRNADSAVNFYLGAAITIAAGLDGIRRRLDPGPSVDYSTYDVSAQDDLAKAAFGPEFHDSYTKYKRGEWQEYCLVVGEWERERYMHIW
jgi:glutamine synthetase